MIAISQQQKEDWEKNLNQLIKACNHEIDTSVNPNNKYVGDYMGRIAVLQDLLSKAVVLPTESDWEGIDAISGTAFYLKRDFPNGVLITNK